MMGSSKVRIFVTGVVLLFMLSIVVAACAPASNNTSSNATNTTANNTTANKSEESSEVDSQQTTSEEQNPNPNESGKTTTGTAGTLTGAALGKQIYDTGKDNKGAVKWTEGKSGMTNGACKQCHGATAKGGVGPALTGSDFTSTFNETTFTQAVTKGLDEKGKPLDSKMPRYSIPTEDTTALWEYLKTLK